MDLKKPRSSLRKATNKEDEDQVRSIGLKRRISFSGKKFVREFDNTEKPKNWDNSYELSDHINTDEFSDCASTVKTIIEPGQTPVSARKSLKCIFDKENRCLSNESEVSQHDLHSLTLLPQEFSKLQRKGNSKNFLATDSFSLSLASSEKLQDKRYSYNDHEKTSDFLPKLFKNLEQSEQVSIKKSHMLTINEQENIVEASVLKTRSETVCHQVSMNISSLDQTNISNQARAVDNAVISSFMDIDSPIATSSSPKNADKRENGFMDACYQNFHMTPTSKWKGRASNDMNTLSLLIEDSSPLIPLDIIAENGIKEKLNLRQLNDEIACGRIKVYQNSPKSASTRKAKLNCFWQGIDENAAPNQSYKNLIKPRSALNFSNDMDMSSMRLTEDCMLTDANRELPKKLVLPNEDDFFTSPKLVESNNTKEHDLQNDGNMKENKVCSKPIGIDITKPAKLMEIEAKACQNSRRTQHFDDPIEVEFLTSPPALNQNKRSIICQNVSQSLHLAEPMEEEFSTSLPNRHQNKESKISKNVRQTLHLDDPMEEVLLTSPPTRDQNKQSKICQSVRQTLFLAEPIKDGCLTSSSLRYNDNENLHQACSKPRQTLHMDEPIEDDTLSFYRPKILNNAPKNLISVLDDKKSARQTVHLAEEIEREDVIVLKPAPSTQNEHKQNLAENHYKCRQTLYFNESIEEDELTSQKSETQINAPKIAISELKPTMPLVEELQLSPKSMSPVQYAAKECAAEMRQGSRQTIYMNETIEDILGTVEIDPPTNQLESKDLSFKQPKVRQTLHMAEPMDEVVLTSPKAGATIDEKNNLDATKLRSDVSDECQKFRKTLHMCEPIEEDVISQSECSVSNSIEKNGHNFVVSKPTAKDDAKKNISKIGKTKYLEMTPVVRKLSLKTYSPYDPTRSITEFENTEEACTHHHIGRKTRRSIYQPVDMEIDSPKECLQTPKTSNEKLINPCGFKRLYAHLTPNVPSAKKRQTLEFKDHVIADASDPSTNNNSVSQGVECNESHTTKIQDTPRKKSLVPILIKKQNSIVSLTASPEPEQSKIEDVEQEMSVQMPRRAIVINDGIQKNFDVEQNKSDGVFEDNPITISDVSRYFITQRADEAVHPECGPRIASLNRKYINLSNDSIFLAQENAPTNEIENTRLSLVSGLQSDLDDASAFKQYHSISIDSNEIANTRLSLVSTLQDDGEYDEVLMEEFAESDPAVQELCNTCDPLPQSVHPISNKKHRAICKKCNSNVTYDDSFALPYETKFPDLGLSRLRKLRERPRLEDVHKYWEIKSLERQSHGADDSSNPDETNAGLADLMDFAQMVDMYRDCMKKYSERLKSTKPLTTEPFSKRLEALLSSQVPSWIFNYQMQNSKKYIFCHRKISTFRIVISYDALDIFQNSIKVRYVKAVPSIVPASSWSAFDHLLDFQLQLKLPLNLTDMVDESDEHGIIKFLQHIDDMCMETHSKCKKLNSMLFPIQARLLREANRTVVKKIVREVIDEGSFNRINKTEFLIQINNVDELSFKDILCPQLHLLNESIQYLPKGIDFVKTFLDNPIKHLKQVD